MISGLHLVLRNAEADDAPDFRRMYYPARPRPSLIDRRREYPIPTVAELREVLSNASTDKSIPDMLVIEDRQGIIRGYCALRPAPVELLYGELGLMLHDDADYATPLAQEAIDLLLSMAFKDKRLRKVVAHALDIEDELRQLLLRNGFASDGLQRQIIYFGGAFHDIEAFTRWNSASAN